MKKKEELKILSIIILITFLILNQVQAGGNSENIDLRFSLEKTSLRSGKEIPGYLILNISGPVDPLTSIKVELGEFSTELSLKDYFSQKNISYEETESSYSVSAPEETKEFVFSEKGIKKFAFKLPSKATVNDFQMTSTCPSDQPLLFPTIDIDDPANKSEWKYFGNRIGYNSEANLPDSLDENNEGDPAKLDNNQTYLCEVIRLPEAKDFQINAKIKKTAEGADIKAAIFSFDWTTAYGGSDVCDMSEPLLNAAPTWQSCNISFSLAKQGYYLICVFYEGDNENDYYEISRDSTISNSRYTCQKTTQGYFPCTKSTSKDYFIKINAGQYSGTLAGSADWETASTDQNMNQSLLSFLSECKPDETGDCIVPVRIISESAGKITFSNLYIDYVELSGASSYSNKLYKLNEIPGEISKIEGVDLSDSTKELKIPLSEFNLTAPNVTDTSVAVFIKGQISPGSVKASVPIKVYKKDYVPSTQSVKEKISDSKAAINNMKNEFSVELNLFQIDLDTEALDNFQNEIMSLESRTDLEIDELQSKIENLSNKIDLYLQKTPKSFKIINSMKDAYIAEPEDIKEVSMDEEEVKDLYIYQTNFEVIQEMINYVLERYDGTKEKYAIIKKIITPQKTLSDDLYIYEIIPKTITNNIVDIEFQDENYEVIKSDPIIRYSSSNFNKPKMIIYGIKGIALTSLNIRGAKTIIVPKLSSSGQIPSDEKTSYTCGDGVCTRPYEDEILCPDDCEKKSKIPWSLIIAIVIVLILGIAYINFYRGVGSFRKLIQKSPFNNPKDLKSVKDYIKECQEKGIENKVISKTLIKNGWKKDQIIYAFEDIKWDEKRAFTINLAPGGHENAKKLKTFIKKCLQLNIPEDKIKRVLIKKGWSTEIVENTFKKVGLPKEKLETEKEYNKKVKMYFEDDLKK